MYATDLSANAIEVARLNVRRHGVSDRVHLLRCDLLSGLPGPVDVIVSNPPYVRSSEIPTLQREVQREPRAALDGGPDGMAVMRRLFDNAPAFLRPGGFMAVEIDPRQRDASLEMARDAFSGARAGCADDLSGRARAIIVETPPSDRHRAVLADPALDAHERTY